MKRQDLINGKKRVKKDCHLYKETDFYNGCTGLKEQLCMIRDDCPFYKEETKYRQELFDLYGTTKLELDDDEDE